MLIPSAGEVDTRAVPGAVTEGEGSHERACDGCLQRGGGLLRRAARPRRSWGSSVKLDQAHCLVTGCSSGIGRATALALADSGAYVVATARDVDSIAGLAAPGLTVAVLDVTDDANVRRVVAAAEPLDVVVNNAGYGLEGAIEEVADDELTAQYDTNVFGVWRICRAVLPGMRARGSGAIVNVSSFGGQAPFPGIGAYRSSKFAVEGLTWTLHLEVAHFGIRVISVPTRPRRNGFRHALLQAGACDRPRRSVCGDASRRRACVRAHVADRSLARSGC